MELRRYLSVLRRRGVYIAVVVLVALGIAWTTTDRTSIYTARTTLFVGSRELDPSTLEGRIDLSFDRVLTLDRLLVTFATMIDSRPVAAEAVERAGISRSADAVVGQLSVAPVEGTQLLSITVSDPDPATAQRLADAVATAFVDLESELEQATAGTDEEGLPIPVGVPVAVFERAQLPLTPEPVGLLGRLVLFGTFGFLLAAAVALGVEYLDVTVKTAEDVERRLGVPALGVVPLLRDDLRRVRTVVDDETPTASPVEEVSGGVA